MIIKVNKTRRNLIGVASKKNSVSISQVTWRNGKRESYEYGKESWSSVKFRDSRHRLYRPKMCCMQSVCEDWRSEVSYSV